MVHGLFTGSVASWYLTAAPTLAQSYAVRLIDWRGHGLSERTRTGYSSDNMAGDLRELTADLPPFALVGHSFGAIVASRFGLANPGRLTKLALVEPPVVDGGHGWWTPADSEDARRRARAEAARSRRGRAVLQLVDETSLLDDLAAEPPFTRDDIRALPDVPVMLVAGDSSPYRAAAVELAAGRPDMQTVVLPGGHEVHLDAKAALTATLSEFLADAA